MANTYVTVDPVSETESAGTQLWKGDTPYSSSSSSEITSNKTHSLTAEIYNEIFLDGFKEAMKTIFEEVGRGFRLPGKRKRPSVDTSPLKAFCEGYNLAIAKAIVQEAGRDGDGKWRKWVLKRWSGRD